MAERSTTWLLRRRRAPIDIAAAIDTFSAGFAFLSESLDEVAGGRVATEIRSVRDARIAAHVPPELAARSARWPWLHTSFDVIEIAHAESCNVADAGAAYWSVFESFDVGWLWDGIGALPRSDRWQTQARASLRDDLMTVLADLTAHVIRTAERLARGLDRGQSFGLHPDDRHGDRDSSGRIVRSHDAVGRTPPTAQPHGQRNGLSAARV